MPQFKSINSGVSGVLLHSPTLTSVLTTGKTTALTRWNFVGKVISLLFNTLSRLVITFLLMSKHLLISWHLAPLLHGKELGKGGSRDRFPLLGKSLWMVTAAIKSENV